MTRTFQIVQPFAAQTVRDNIAVGAHLHVPRRAAALAEADRVAARVGLGGAARQARRRPDRGRAASGWSWRARWPRGRRLLLLDEVLAGLNPQEIGEMVPVGRKDIAASGITVLMIEHVMQAVMNLAAARVGAGAGPADRRGHAGGGDDRRRA